MLLLLVGRMLWLRLRLLLLLLLQVRVRSRPVISFLRLLRREIGRLAGREVRAGRRWLRPGANPLIVVRPRSSFPARRNDSGAGRRFGRLQGEPSGQSV